MRIEEIKLFKFEELSEEAQEKAIEKNIEINVYDGWYEFELDFIKEELLEKYGIKCKTMYFDFGRNRHICLDEPSIEDDKILKAVNSELKDISLWIDSEREHTFIRVEDDFNYEDIEGQLEEIYIEDREREIEELQEKLNEFLSDILFEYLKQLEKQYNYLLSEEAIKENIICNEMEFKENGECW